MIPTPPALGWVLLYVNDVPASTEFYVDALGLAVRFADDSGEYTEMETGATTLALCARTLAAQSTGLDLGGRGAPCGNVTLVYPDVPAAYAHAVSMGAAPVHEPVTKPWGQVSSYVRDTDGNLIEIVSAINP